MKFINLVVLSLLLSCSKGPSDWDRFCQIVTEASQNPEADPAMRAVLLAQKISSDHSWSKEFTKTFEAIAAADPKEKYKLMQRAAVQAGNPNWSCPAYLKMMGP